MDHADYELCRKECEEQGCYIPEEHIFHQTIANTPLFVRAYFYRLGKMKGGRTKVR